MSPTQSAMLKRIGELKESTLAACTTISAHLREGSSLKSDHLRGGSSLNLRQGSSLKSDLKPLIVELRLLAGALYSLESLITELGEDENGMPVTETTEWPLVDGCEMLINALRSFHSFATPDGLKAARSSLLDNRSKLGFVLGSSESLQDIALQFSILGSNSVPQLMVERMETDAVESPALTRDEAEPSAEEVSAWLTALNSSDNDREPAEYNREIALVQSRRITTNYRTAATRWPEYAERYWQKLRPQVCSLFRIQRSYSFVQWVLEYARETYPRALGPLSLSPRLLLELTDALCDGSVSSLHIAAALGLPSLCRDLLSMGADINKPSILGTPLFCSLMGTKVLATRAEPESWGSLLVSGDCDVERAATVLLLLDANADCTYRYNWKNADEVSLAGLAFWVAMTTKHEAIFTRIVKGGSELDGAFLELMQRETLVMRGLFHKARFARLLTFIYDLTLADLTGGPLEYGELQKTVSQLMKHANINFSFSEGSRKITTLDDVHVAEVTRNAVLDSDVTLIERLTSDPRFDPNLPSDKHGLSGTILHTATEGSQLEIMDILIGAGADLRSRDSSGRPPLMVVEHFSALAKLVLEYGAPTTDTDGAGRTIWHLCASTNDVTLLKWLWENDPRRNQNLSSVDGVGHTPLMASFAYIDRLAQPPRGLRKTTPSAARFLLESWQDHIYFRGNEQLAHWAIQWGDANLVNKVLEILPEAAENDRFLLKSLNMAASTELLSVVMDKCRGSALQFIDGTTVAETIITNTKITSGRYGAFSLPTAHPSCFPSITRQDYERLLTPEVLKSRDAAGRGIWERFCNNILPLLYGNGPSANHPSSLSFLSLFISLAIRCLVEHGALADYERETGRCALQCIADTQKRENRPYWQNWQFPFITTVLQASSTSPSLFLPSMTPDGPNAFCTSFEAAMLLQQAVHHRLPELVGLLVNTGINVHAPWDRFLHTSVFEAVLDDVDLGMIRLLLSNSKPEDVKARQFDTFDKLHIILDTPLAVEAIIQLIQHGMDPNILPKDELDRHGLRGVTPPPWPMLTEAISQHKTEVACALLKHGADPVLAASDGYNAVIAAAHNDQVIVMEEIVEMVPKDFNWLCVYEGEDGVTYNALQIAAANGHREILEILLGATPLDKEIDSVTPKNGLPPAHLAAKTGSLDCIKMLARYGANLEATDSSGRSVLFWAILRGHADVVEYLKDSLLDPEQDPDHDYGISVLAPLDPPAGSDVQELVSRPFHGRTTESTRASEQRKLGAMIAETMSSHRPSSEGLFPSLLHHISKEELESAILPCDGCTLLSYAAANSLIAPMVELLELGFTGFVSGCKQHWPDGYNALLHACQNIHKLFQLNIFTTSKKVYTFIEKCLDAYLAEGRLWFHLPQPPIHAICQYQQIIGGTTFEPQEKVLKIFIDHLEAHADKYWGLVERLGLLDQYDIGGGQDTKTRLLRFALNVQSQVHMGSVYYGGGNPTALHVLVQSSARNDSLSIDADTEPCYNMVRMLLSHGADVNARDTELLTPLHSAVDYNLEPMAKILLEAGAQPNARDYEGTTPLGQAAVVGNMDMIHSLIAHGADARTFDGMDFRGAGSDMDLMHQLLNLGLNPYETILGNAGILSTLIGWNAAARTYALNGPFDFYRLAEGEPWFLTKLMSQTCLPSDLRAVLRRLPRELLDQVVNFEPQSGLGAGCLAIRMENVGLLEQLLNFGFDAEREWCDKGSALMFAGYIGAEKSFKMLVRRGARLSYTGTDKRGRSSVRSVVEATRVYPELMQWVLVGRYYEGRCIEAHSGRFAATRPWSGPRRAAYRFSGNQSEHSRLRSESTIDYLVRVSGLRRRLAGKMVPATLVE